MSDDKIKRRRFLADLLFAGGAVTAAALLAQAGSAEKKPATPSPSPTGPQLDGDVATPTSPTPKPPGPPEPALGGKPMAPMVKGEVSVPQRPAPPKKP